MITCTRKLTFCAAHRLLGHEGACADVHGHNYTVDVTVVGQPDAVGRVVDFAVIKERIGNWIDVHWDHGFIYNDDDEATKTLLLACGRSKGFAIQGNPTAENMAEYLLNTIAPQVMSDIESKVVGVRVWETDNCYGEAVQDQ